MSIDCILRSNAMQLVWMAPAPILFLMLPPPMLKPSTTATLSPITVLAPCSALDRRLLLLRVRGQGAATLMLAQPRLAPARCPLPPTLPPHPPSLCLAASELRDTKRLYDCTKQFL